MKENNTLSPQIHNYYLSYLKKILGASFVGWVQEKDKKYLEVKINKKSIIIPFESDKEITEYSYKKLIEDIYGNAKV